MADSYDISITQGSSFLLRIIAKDSAGVAMNLSGYTVRGYVRNTFGNTGILADLNPVITSSPEGIVDLSISGNVTALLPVTQAVYDVEAISSSDFVTKFLKGYANVNPEATY